MVDKRQLLHMAMQAFIEPLVTERDLILPKLGSQQALNSLRDDRYFSLGD
jgi:hypothetical protein